MKAKGSAAERELVAMFWETGNWAALRLAGSGSMKFPAVDVMAGDGERVFAIECKSTKGQYQYIKAEQIGQLTTFSEKFGARPIIAVKFSTIWYFLNISDMSRTPSGEYVITRKTASVLGKSFEDLLNFAAE